MSEKALAIPELIAALLQHLDLTSLVAAAQVNRLWAHEATSVRTVPSLQFAFFDADHGS